MSTFSLPSSSRRPTYRTFPDDNTMSSQQQQQQQQKQQQQQESTAIETSQATSSSFSSSNPREALLSAAAENDHADQEHDDAEQDPPPPSNPAAVYRNFVFMAILFSIHHGCVVSCLSLATARLGATIGAQQSSILYLAYTGSALVGATYVTKRWGAHRTLVMGLFLYCFYVSAFGVAARYAQQAAWTAYLGALMGGLGAGLVWTAQGSFFAQAAQAHAQAATQDSSDHDDDDREDTSDQASQSTARMAGVFAFFYLALELLLRSLSSLAAWKTVFYIYGLLTILATVGMAFLVQPPNLVAERVNKDRLTASLLWYQITAAVQLWKPSPDGRWPVMPLMLGLNAVFGLESAFLNAYINGQVVSSDSIGLWTAWASGVAALWSLIFGKFTAVRQAEGSSFLSSVWSNRKGWVLSAGALCFASVLLPFVVQPNVEKWKSSSAAWWIFFLIYTLHGTGRATFEGTLKATFADFFNHEKEGAFANIILQNGLASSFGFFLASRLPCDGNSRDAYCVPFQDGTYHHMGWMEVLIVIVAILAIAAYWKAAYMVKEREQRRTGELRDGGGK